MESNAVYQGEQVEERRFAEPNRFPELDRHNQIDNHFYNNNYNYNNNPRNEFNGYGSTTTRSRDDSGSCLPILLSFCFFGALSLMVGVYGPKDMMLGRNSSILIHRNTLFVRNIKVEKLVNSKSGMTLFGFHKPPPLDVVTTWSEIHNVSISNYSHREWLYYLNEGSKLKISYDVSSFRESSVVLVIAKGFESLSKWLEDPAYPRTTLSWNVIHGRGMIQQDISDSSSYYVAFGNLEKSEAAEVQFNISIDALLYNTTEAYYTCSLNDGLCSFKLNFLEGNVAVLTSSGPDKAISSKELSVKLSYEPRWLTYIVGLGGMAVLILQAFNFMKKSRRSREEGSGQMGSDRDRDPLLSNKVDHVSTCGSSYDSVLHHEEDPSQGMPLKEGENNNDQNRLCVICFEAPKDSFFLPCGHCATCFTCGTRIAEATGLCPICRRNTKKVNKIYTV